MPEDDRFRDPYESTASWLREVAQRRPAPATPLATEPSAPAAPPPQHTARRIVLFALLALSVFQYYMLDVMLTIYTLPQMIVFAQV